MTLMAALRYSESMQRHQRNLLTLVSLLLFTFSTLVFAKTPDGFEIQINGQNGAANFPAGRSGRSGMDSAIRVTLTFNNTKIGKIKVTKVEGAFFGADGTELEKVSAGPLEIPSKGSDMVGLFYSNPSNLYEFTLKGTVTYEKDGKTTTVPFTADAASLVQPRIVNF